MSKPFCTDCKATFAATLVGVHKGTMSLHKYRLLDHVPAAAVLPGASAEKSRLQTTHMRHQDNKSVTHSITRHTYRASVLILSWI